MLSDSTEDTGFNSPSLPPLENNTARDDKTESNGARDVYAEISNTSSPAKV